MAEPDEIMDDLYSMAANAGQETILDAGSGGFMNWGGAAINNNSYPDFQDMRGSLFISDEMYDATGEIWDEGYGQVCEAWEEAQEESLAKNLIPGGWGNLFGFF